MVQCPECKGERLRKEGFATRWRDRQSYKLQRYRCVDCGVLTTRPLNGANPEDNAAVPVKHRLTCLRCGHQWESVKDHPLRCGKCKSPYWDKLKKEE